MFKRIIKLIFVCIFVFVGFCSTNVVFAKENDSYYKKSDDAKELSTYEIINHIVDNELWYIDLFSSQFIGVEKFKVNNVYYKELKERTGALDIINNLINRESDRKRNDSLLLLRDILTNNYNYTYQSSDLSRSSNIYAPNGTEIEYAIYKVNTYDQSDIVAAHNEVISVFSYLNNDDNIVFDANDAYNCHSFAWYKQTPNNNNYWIYYPTSYLLDNSYYEVTGTVRTGDILCYYSEGYYEIEGIIYYGQYISHSAIVVNNNGLNLSNNDTLVNVDLISKFGKYGVYNHNGYYCYYSHYYDSSFQYVKAYRPKTDVQYTFNEYTQPFSRSFAASSNNKYEMYEINVNYSRNYHITVLSSYALDVRLYSKNMKILSSSQSNSTSFSINTSLSTDIYYLRVAYQNSSNSGTITTNVTGHTHSSGAPYTWTSYTKHEATCVCGTTFEEFHVVSSSGIPGSPFATCMLCGGQAIGIIRNNHNLPTSENGSYILPNGIIVLEDEDIQAYLLGTLIFN